ncbi:MAG: hypothetical protein JNL56_08525 [Alphaproteobacteria bacterium]|nr:hypothetical protein [Alphaproteobacteria bacterium]
MSGPPHLAAIQLIAGRPLVVCDADEVLLQFLGGLEAYLPSQGLYLDLEGYALTGSIRRAATGEPLVQTDVGALIKAFHETAGLALQPVAGAAAALADLATTAQIVILTNVAQDLAVGRRANLAGHGMDYPVVPNSGLKGPAVSALAARAQAPVFFIDDIPHHHASVAEAAPGTHQIHFVADERLFRMAKASPHAGLFTSDWAEAGAHVRARLDQDGG